MPEIGLLAEPPETLASENLAFSCRETVCDAPERVQAVDHGSSPSLFARDSSPPSIPTVLYLISAGKTRPGCRLDARLAPCWRQERTADTRSYRARGPSRAT